MISLSHKRTIFHQQSSQVAAIAEIREVGCWIFLFRDEIQMAGHLVSRRLESQSKHIACWGLVDSRGATSYWLSVRARSPKAWLRPLMVRACLGAGQRADRSQGL